MYRKTQTFKHCDADDGESTIALPVLSHRPAYNSSILTNK